MFLIYAFFLQRWWIRMNNLSGGVTVRMVRHDTICILSTEPDAEVVFMSLDQPALKELIMLSKCLFFFWFMPPSRSRSTDISVSHYLCASRRSTSPKKLRERIILRTSGRTRYTNCQVVWETREGYINYLHWDRSNGKVTPQRCYTHSRSR